MLYPFSEPFPSLPTNHVSGAALYSLFMIFQLKQSRFLIFYLCLIHSFAVICCCFCFSNGMIIASILIALFSFLYFFNLARQFHLSLTFLSDQHWVIHFSQQRTEHAVLLGKSVLTQFFCVLYFQLLSNERRFTFLILLDSLPKNAFPVFKRCIRMSKIL